MFSALIAATVLAASPELGFGFTNESGDRVLSLDETNTAFTKATCGGEPFAVKFEANQPEGTTSTGRQTARNFAQLAGARFEVVGGKASADASCLLGTDAAFAGRKFLPVQQIKHHPCDAKAAAIAAKLGKRKVLSCVTNLSFEKGRVHFAEFARVGADALVGVIFEPASGAASMRSFPAKVVKDSPTCWRVDDGCKFPPGSYRVAVASSGKAGWELFAQWGGAESENIELLRVKGTTLTPAMTSSRYWSPE